VSMPCREWFDAESAEYREQVLPRAVSARVVVEAAASFGWEGVAGPDGVIVGIDEFGLSAPAADALRERGMTTDRVVAAVRTAAARAAAARAGACPPSVPDPRLLVPSREWAEGAARVARTSIFCPLDGTAGPGPGAERRPGQATAGWGR
jgi:hypothetical protein